MLRDCQLLSPNYYEHKCLTVGFLISLWSRNYKMIRVTRMYYRIIKIFLSFSMFDYKQKFDWKNLMSFALIASIKCLWWGGSLFLNKAFGDVEIDSFIPLFSLVDR